ncbi:MAG: RHS repeat-associated core domain-containing protein, partial [Planctomycetota bacterium]
LRHQLVYAGTVNVVQIEDNIITLEELLRQQGFVHERTENRIAQKTSYEYDNLGRVILTTGPLGSGGRAVSSQKYNENGSVTDTIVTFNDKDGSEKSLASNTKYDRLDRPYEATGPETGDGRVTTKTSYYVDGKLKETSVSNPNDDDGWSKTNYTYDTLGRTRTVLTDDDAKSGGRALTQFWYDAAGRVARNVNPFGLETISQYDAAGLLHQQKAPRTRVSLDGYVGAAYVTSTMLHNHAGATTRVSSKAYRSDTDAVIANYGTGVSTTYDNHGRVLTNTQRRSASKTSTTTFQYDSFGNRTKVIDPEGNVTKFGFDNLGRTISDQQIGLAAAGGDDSRQFEYDSFGNVISTTNRNNAKIKFVHDNHGKVVLEDWIGSSYSASFQYTGLGELHAWSNSDRRDGSVKKIAEQSVTYDAGRRADRVEQRLEALDEALVTFDYDHNVIGNITQSTTDLPGTANDFTNNYSFDNRNRIEKVAQSPGQGSSVNEKAVTFDHEYRNLTGTPFQVLTTFQRRYNNDGTEDVFSSTKRNLFAEGSTWLVHHFEGDLPSSATAGSSVNPVDEDTFQRVFYAHDPRGLVTNRKESEWNSDEDSAEHTYKTYSYDLAGQLTRYTEDRPGNDDPDPVDYIYDDNGNRLTEGSTGTHNRLLGNGRTLYGYDDEGNMTQRFRAGQFVVGDEHGGTFVDTISTPETHWKLGKYRLDFAKLEMSGVYDEDQIFADIYFNGTLLRSEKLTLTETSESGTFAAALEDPYWFTVTTAGNAELEIAIDDRSAYDDPEVDESSSFEVYRYGTVETFEWDHRSRLKAVREYEINESGNVTHRLPGNGGTVKGRENSRQEYDYDAIGQLVSKREFGQNDSLSSERAFVWDRGQRVADIDTMDANKTVRANRLYAPGVDTLVAADIRSDRVQTADGSPVTVWPLVDHRGSVTALAYEYAPNANTFKQVINTIPYSPFGTPLRIFSDSSDVELQNLISQLAVFDAGREYDFDTGFYFNRARWYNPEIGRFISQDPIGFRGGDTNLYRYAGNSPQNGTDPSGNIVVTLGIAATLGALSLYSLNTATDQYNQASEMLADANFDVAEYNRLVQSAQFYDTAGTIGAGAAIGFAMAPAALAAGGYLASGIGLSATSGTLAGSIAYGATVLGTEGVITGGALGGLMSYANGDGISDIAYNTGTGALYGGLTGGVLGGAGGAFRFAGSALMNQTRGIYQLAYRNLRQFHSPAAARQILSANIPFWYRVGVPLSGGVIGSAAAHRARLFAPKKTPSLYWHGSTEGVEAATRNGLFAHGTGSGSKFWATTRGKPGGLTEFLIGGNRNVDSLIPFRTSTKGGFEAVYQLTAEEAAMFSRAWGFKYSWNPYQWYKGAIGQYVYAPKGVSWGQRGIEVGRFGAISSIIVGGLWISVEISDWLEGK